MITEADLPDKIEALIQHAVAENKLIKVIAYTVIPMTETGLRRISEVVLDKYNKLEILPAVVMILKELALNAAKANFKRILFQSKNLDLENLDDYEIGMKEFKELLSEDWAVEYGKKSKKINLHVEIKFNYNEQRLLLQVINNFPLSQTEEARVREKLKMAMRYEDIGQFFMECGDETEGAGLGLVLIMTALKSFDIDPHAFTIFTNKKNQTVARIEFPLQPGYTISRNTKEAL